MHADIIQGNNLTHTQSKSVNPVRWSQIWYTEPVSCSNDCATIESYTILLLESSSGIPLLLTKS